MKYALFASVALLSAGHAMAAPPAPTPLSALSQLSAQKTASQIVLGLQKVSGQTIIGGITVGTAGQPGTIYSGYTLAGGDTFTGNTPDLVSAYNPAGLYFPRPFAIIPGPGNEPNAKSALNSFDVDPYWTGTNDVNRGVAPSSIVGTITQANGISLNLRAATTAEYSLAPWGQHEIGSAINGSGALDATPPCIIEADISYVGNTNTYSADHPSFWFLGMANGVGSWNAFEADFEGNPEENGSGVSSGPGTYDANSYPHIAGVGGTTSGSNVTGSTVNPGLWEGAEHRLSYIILPTTVSWAVDGNIIRTVTTNTQIGGVSPLYWIASHHAMANASISAWPSPVPFVVHWVRVWSATGVTRTPATVIPPTQCQLGVVCSVTIPSSLATWRAASVNDNLFAVPVNARDPGGDFNGTWAGGGAPFPPCLTYSGGVLSGTCYEPGRVYFERVAGLPGDAVVPQRFYIDWAPQVLTPAAGINCTVGSSCPYDFYPEGDAGALPLSMVISGQSALGLTSPLAGPSGGKQAGTLTALGAISVSVASPGGTATKTIPIGPSTAGNGEPAPVLPGYASPAAEGIVASIDCDNTSSVTFNGSGIASIAGADGTSYAAVQPTPAAQPTQSLINGHYWCVFNGTSQYLSWASMISGQANVFSGSGAYTILAVVKLYNTTSQSIIDISQGAGTTTANRASLLVSSSAGFIHRAGGALTTDASNGAVDTNVHFLMARRLTNSILASLLDVDKTGGNFAATAVAGMTSPPDTAVIGVRVSASTTYDIFSSVRLARLIVINRALKDGEGNFFRSWSAARFGSP